MAATSIRIVDPDTGAPLLAQATLENCYVVIAHQIFPYTIPRVGSQHTDYLKEPYVLGAQSYALSFHMITGATKGQIMRAEAIGNAHGGSHGKVT